MTQSTDIDDLTGHGSATSIEAEAVENIADQSENLLVLSPFWSLESSGAASVVLFHRYRGKRLRLSMPVYQLLLDLAIPTLVDTVSDRFSVAGIEPILKDLRKYELLIKPTALPDMPPRPALRRVDPTLFRVPSGQLDDPRTDVAVVGVPYDGSNVVKPGSRFGPTDIREVSVEYEYKLDLITGSPRGWYDFDRGERVLDGVTIADWGDIRVGYGLPTEATSSMVEEVCRNLVNRGSIPLLLGGDHSVSYSAVKVCQEHRNVCVFWFDAHNDLGDLESLNSHHHGNVARRISLLPRVDRLFVIGQRGMVSIASQESYPAKISVVPLAQLPSELPKIDSNSGVSAYISVDIDVLDPAFAPGTATPVVGGMTPKELYDSMEAIAGAVPVCGFDVVEVNCVTDPNKITARHAAALILKALTSISRRKG